MFNANQVINIEREYKIMSINENKDIETKEPTVLIEMSRIDKIYHNHGNGYIVTNMYNPSNFDLFIYKGDSINSFDCFEICNNPKQNKIINLSEYRVSNVNYDGMARSAFYLDK